MQIVTLGTKGEIEESDKNHKKNSGVLINSKDTSILLDCGNSEFLKKSPDAIVMTHGHPDHIEGLSKKVKVPVYAPKEAEDNIKELGVKDIEIYESYTPWNVGGIKLEGIPVLHSIKEPAHGIKLLVDDKTVFYAPDFIGLRDTGEENWKEKLGDVDIWIGDSSAIDQSLIRTKEGDDIPFGHAQLEDIIGMASEVGTDTFIATHLGKTGVEMDERNLENKIEKMCDKKGIEKSFVAKDGKVFNEAHGELGGAELIDPEQFKEEGIDEDMKHPKTRWRELLADLRYLGNSGWPKLTEEGESWGDFTPDEKGKKFLLKYYAEIVDTLRSVHFTLIPPFEPYQDLYKELNPDSDLRSVKNSSYWEAYKEAEQYMDSEPPSTKEKVEEWDEKRKETIETSAEELDTTKEDFKEIEPIENDIQATDGLYLVEPHAIKIAKGEKLGILKSSHGKKMIDEYVSQPVYILGDYCYGIMTLSEPKKISNKEFYRLQDLHEVSKKERKDWWGDKQLWLFTLSRDRIYKEPKEYERKQGAQVIMKNVELQEETKKIAIATNNEKTIAERFGRANKFLVFKNDEKMNEIENEFKDNKGEVAWSVIESLVEKGIDKVVASNFGSNAHRAFEENDMEYEEAEGEIKSYLDKELELEVLDELLDDLEIRGLEKDELLDYMNDLIETWKEGKEFDEEKLAKNLALIVDEMGRREYDINELLPDNDLVQKSKQYQKEYPEPWEVGEASEGSPKAKLSEVLNAFPRELEIKENPPHIYLIGRTVNKGESPKGHDIDILVKQKYRDPRLVKAIKSALPDKISKQLHIVFDPEGPSIGKYIPLYNLAYHERKDKSNTGKKKVKCHNCGYEWETDSKLDLVTCPNCGIKTSSNLKTELVATKDDFDFGDRLSMVKPEKTMEYIHRLNNVYKEWAKKRLPEPGITVEPKWDGIHFQVQKNGDKVWLITEKEERSDNLPHMTQAIKNGIKADKFIGEAEVVKYKSGKRKEPFMRKDFIEIATGDGEQDDTNIAFHFWDILNFEGEFVNEKDLKDRHTLLSKSIDESNDYLDVADMRYVEDKEELAKAVFKLGNRSDSEGAMLKSLDFKYPITEDKISRVRDIAKFKNLKELDVIALDKSEVIREGKHTGVWNYQCYFGPLSEEEIDSIQKDEIEEYKGDKYALIGTSYNTDSEINKGGILTVAPVEVKIEKNDEGKEKFTWQFPEVIGPRPQKDEPDDYEFMKKMHEKGINPQVDSWKDLLKQEELERIKKLQPCPYQEDLNKCPLVKKYAKKFGSYEKELEKIEELQFPVKCEFANKYHCPYIKDYYYKMEEK